MSAEEPPTAYAPAPATTALLAVVSVVAALLGVRAPGAGRVLAGVVALAATYELARAALLRPTLRVGPGGLDVATGFWGRDQIAWEQLEQGRAVSHRRRGATARWLELDTGDRLVTVPAYRLGAPVAVVAAAIEAARPS